jgi:rhodanese-related sulfurtransferase
MARKSLMFAVVIVFTLLLVGVAMAAESATDVVGPKVKAMLETTKAGVNKVPASAAKTAIDSKEKAVILDVRDGAEFSAGHLPGAINISRGTLEMNVAEKIPDLNVKIYVYCKTAGRAALATKTLNDLGYKNAMLVDLQYADWVKAGYSVER